MTDDIETLRNIFNQVMDDEPRKQAIAALERAETRITALERYAVEGQDAAKQAIDDRDSLRAKLERAKATLAETRRLVSQCALHGFVGEAPLQELFVNNGKISAVLSELSADAPAPFDVDAVYKKLTEPDASAQQTQISDEVREAME